MKILFDARPVLSRSDGMGNYVRHLIIHLLRIDKDNEYIVLLNQKFYDELASTAIIKQENFHTIISAIPAMGPSQHLQIPFLIKRLAPIDMYHYPHFDMPVFAHSRSVVTIFDLNQFRFSRYFKSLRHLKRLYSYGTTWHSSFKAQHIITISDTTKAHLLEKFPWLDENKISVIYFGLNDSFNRTPSNDEIDSFRQKYNLGNNRYVLYVGTNRPHKNVNRLLEAFALLPNRCNTDHKLLLVGCSNSAQLIGKIRALGIEEKVRVLEYISDEDLPLSYRVADLFAFCSLSEGFGMPLLEAFASGVPVVTSSMGAMKEIASDSARLVDSYSVESIVDGLANVIGSDSLRLDLIAKGHKRVGEFTWEDNARRTLEIYNSISLKKS